MGGECEVGGIEAIGLARRLGEPVTGGRVAVDGDGPPCRTQCLLERSHTLLGLERVVGGDVPENGDLRPGEAPSEDGPVVDDRCADDLPLCGRPDRPGDTKREADRPDPASGTEPPRDVIDGCEATASP